MLGLHSSHTAGACGRSPVVGALLAMSSSPKMAVSAVRAEDAGKGSILLDSRDDGVTVAVVNGSFVSLVDTECVACGLHLP